jgi:hypothetical protein
VSREEQFWCELSRSIKLTAGKVSEYPLCYTTDLVALAPKNRFFVKNISASGSDTDKFVSLKKALMELIERTVFIKNIDISHSKENTRVSTRGWACHFNEEKAKELAVLELYEDYLLHAYEGVLHGAQLRANTLNHNKDFGFFNLKAKEVYFSMVWIKTKGGISLGTACRTQSAQAYEKALQEAYVKKMAGIYEKDAGFILPPVGYYEINFDLPMFELEQVQDKILSRLDLYVYKALACQRILH